MTAALLTSSRGRGSGLRPVNPARDLVAIADLIEMAFSQRMDSSSRRMVREMRTLGRLGAFGALAARFLLPPAASPQGFVWEEEGRVVGNASLLPVRGLPERWVLANVAVHPDYRRRGIGKRLTEACIDLACSKGARILLLQVDRDNTHAQVMYAAMGFRPIATRTTWMGPAVRPPASWLGAPEVRPRRDEDWQTQASLARRVYPEGLIFPYPLTAASFQPHKLLGVLRLENQRHWVGLHHGRLAGSITVRPGLDPEVRRVILIVDPEARGEMEGWLLARAMDHYQGKGIYFEFDYPAGFGEAIFGALGFHPRRTLTWMRMDLPAGGKDER